MNEASPEFWSYSTNNKKTKIDWFVMEQDTFPAFSSIL